MDWSGVQSVANWSCQYPPNTTILKPDVGRQVDIDRDQFVAADTHLRSAVPWPLTFRT